MTELYIDELLKDATSKKSSGDFDGAINSLRLAFEKIKKTDISYPVETFLRLPLYLQSAKRNDEAWREFNNLIAYGYPNQLNYPDIRPYEESIIYDKMRLFLQRENKNELAIFFGIYSYLKCAIALHRQKRNEELSYHKKELEEYLLPLLKKAKIEHLIKDYSNAIKPMLSDIEKINFDELKNRLSELNTKK
ncbi:hypothetical protein VR611_04980 [Aquirufa nivalisilvae]